MEKQDASKIIFEKMELNFKKSVLRGVALFGAILLLLQIFTLQLVSDDSFFLSFNFGIFDETQLPETVIIENDEYYNGPDFDMHIENITAENNIVTVTLRMKIKDDNSDILNQQEFILTGYNNHYTFNKYYTLNSPQVLCCYGGERQIIVQYEIPPQPTDITDAQIYYLQCINDSLSDNVIFKLSF